VDVVELVDVVVVDSVVVVTGGRITVVVDELVVVVVVVVGAGAVLVVVVDVDVVLDVVLDVVVVVVVVDAIVVVVVGGGAQAHSPAACGSPQSPGQAASPFGAEPSQSSPGSRTPLPHALTTQQRPSLLASLASSSPRKWPRRLFPCPRRIFPPTVQASSA